MEQNSHSHVLLQLQCGVLGQTGPHGCGPRAPSLDEANDLVKEGEWLSLGETELSFLGHPDLLGFKSGLKPLLPGMKLPVGAKFQRNHRPFTREDLLEDRPTVALAGKHEVR